MERLGMEEDVPIEAPLVNRAIENAQQKVEAMHFDTRKNLFEYDNVMNEQRKAIYALRKQILEGRYRPEILDDDARKEQVTKMPPAPEKSGPHTIASLAKQVSERVKSIVDAHIVKLLDARGELPETEEAGAPYRAGGKMPFPKDGIEPEALTHELYRHFGAMVPFAAVKHDYDATLKLANEDVARALIQQRERLHDLAYANVGKTVEQLCPPDTHPDEWDIEALEKQIKERYSVSMSIRDVPQNVEDLIDLCWDAVEKLLLTREQEFGLYVYLFHIRQLWLGEIDAQWIAHLKNIEHLRTGIGLVGYATRNPKNEYKIRGYNLFREMWESIEQTVLDKVINMKLTEEQRQQAEEGAEYETALTRANSRRGASPAQQRGAATRAQVDRLSQAARQAAERMQAAMPAGAQPEERPQRTSAPAMPEVGANDPCPCGSGKRYKKCHGARKAS
jgi:preprotein translocase subunit SecA